MHVIFTLPVDATFDNESFACAKDGTRIVVYGFLTSEKIGQTSIGPETLLTDIDTSVHKHLNHKNILPCINVLITKISLM